MSHNIKRGDQSDNQQRITGESEDQSKSHDSEKRTNGDDEQVDYEEE